MRMEPAFLGLPADTPATLGGRIAAARRAKGLTQEQLGQGMALDGSDLGKAAVSAWEVDRNQPAGLQVAKLADRLHVSTEYLLRGRQWNGVERRDPAGAGGAYDGVDVDRRAPAPAGGREVAPEAGVGGSVST
jgi:transcriptional regulator with XRE-family HTH domain